MILGAYTLLDSKTGIYHTPWFAPHPYTAMRQVQALTDDKNTFVGKHPADYILFKVAQYDDGTGVITPCEHVSFGTCAGISAQNMAEYPKL